MTRGDIYLVKKSGANDPKKQRAFVVVSRQVLVESKYATVVCAPIYTSNVGLASQVAVGVEQGLKHASAIHCDGLVSLQKSALADYVGSLGGQKTVELNQALKVALEIED
jgi:mRNA interferase MazF